MLFNFQSFLMLGIFFKEITTAESYWGELINLGRAKSEQDLSNFEFSNCSLFSIAYGSTCKCLECTDERCTICCNSPGFTCCYCHACVTSCWNNNWQLISPAQVGLSTALLIATVATIALFFRICNGGFHLGRQPTTENSINRGMPSRFSMSSVQRYVIERLRDRPPQYNDFPGAPPLYDTDPANRVATIEDPPKYTRKPRENENTIESERQNVNNNETSVPAAAAANHI